MPISARLPSHIRFADFELDTAAGQLRRRGVHVPLRHQVVNVLILLLEHRGEIVTREDLRRRLWPDDVFVDFDNNLNTAIARLRERLSDSADRPRFIETVSKRGYRFICDIAEQTAEAGRGRSPGTRLVVLPFVNLSGDPAQEYLSDAITEEIITEIGGAAPEQLAVIARTTAMRYKGGRKDITQVGRELAVNHVVEGSVRRDEDHIVINAQLIEVNSRSHQWAQRYDSAPGELLQTERDIAAAILAQLGITYAEKAAKQKKPAPGTRDPQAHFLYMQGRFHLNQWSPVGITKARECFEQAIARDPEFALAYDSLAQLIWLVGFMGYMPAKEAFASGVYAALRALEIDPSLGETHALLGMYRKELDYNWPEVHREMMLGFRLKPSSPVVRLRYALSSLLPHGRLEEAIEQLRLALEDDPMSLDVRGWLAFFYSVAGQYDLGLAQIQIVLDLDPLSLIGHLMAGHLHRDAGNHTAAVAAFSKACEIASDLPFCLGWLGHARAMNGDAEGARVILDLLRVIGTQTQTYVPPFGFAWIHFALGEMDEAFLWLERAIEARDPMIIPIKTYPFLDPIRSDPRYRLMLDQMRLEP